MYCSKCGNEIDKSVKFCPDCGNAINDLDQSTQDRNERESGDIKYYGSAMNPLASILFGKPKQKLNKNIEEKHEKIKLHKERPKSFIAIEANHDSLLILICVILWVVGVLFLNSIGTYLLLISYPLFLIWLYLKLNTKWLKILYIFTFVAITLLFLFL